MSAKPAILEMYFDPAEIENFDAFEQAREDAYELPKDERADALAELLEDTQTTAGEAMLDAMLMGVTAEENLRKSEQLLKKAQLFAGKTLVVTQIDVESAELKGVFIRKEIPKDEKRIARQKSMADKIGYGPKVNDSSFRTHTGTSRPRRHG